MAFTLPALPYAFEALEPNIDTTTMQIHHGKHHQAYIDNLNKAIAGTPNEGKSLEELVQKAGSISPAVRNNAGGHWNHSFFWEILSPSLRVRLPESWPMRSTPPSAVSLPSREKFNAAGGDPFRQRLGMADRKGWKAGGQLHSQPGQSPDGCSRSKGYSDPGRRRMGTCVLFEISEQARRLSRGLLESGGIGIRSPSITPRPNKILS